MTLDKEPKARSWRGHVLFKGIGILEYFVNLGLSNWQAALDEL